METNLQEMSRKEALLALGKYSHEHFGHVVKETDQTNQHSWRWTNRTDARNKCQELAGEFNMSDNEFYMFVKYKLQLFDAVESINTELKEYFISVVDILRTIGMLRKTQGDEAARKFINRFTKAKGARKMTVLAGSAFNTEFVNGIVEENPKTNVFLGKLDKGVEFVLVESNATKAEELKSKLAKGSVKVLLDKPKPGSTKYGTVRLIMEN